MKNKMKKYFLAILLTLLPAVRALAFPISFSHQGLVREQGELVNGFRIITATLYSSDNGSIIGREMQNTLIKDGYYTITISEVNEEQLLKASGIMLGIRFDDQQELMPRLPVSVVPYAVMSKYAITADNLDCEGCVSREHLDFDPDETVKTLNYAASSTIGGVALAAEKLTCTNCVDDTQTAINYALADSKGGVALAAAKLTCKDCVDDSQVAINYALADAKGGAALAIANGIVTSAKIGSQAVTSGKIAPEAVDKDNLKANAVSTDKLQNYAVTSGKIGEGAVTMEKIASGAVGTTQLANNAVSTAKLLSSSVTTDKLYNKSVTAEKMGTNAALSNLSASGYYPARAWISFTYVNQETASSYDGNRYQHKSRGASMSIDSDGYTMHVRFDKAMSDVFYAISLSFNPAYNISQSEYMRIYVPQIINKGLKGFDIVIYRCVAEVDGTHGASCGPDTNWINNGTTLSAIIYE